MKNHAWTIVLLISLVEFTHGENITHPIEHRAGKFALFQVVKFPNDICSSSSSKNGTCYTSSECSKLGGTSSGSCASGYGVCCTFVLGCGSSSSQNSTYFEVSGATTGACSATICKANSNICQIRLDFNTFVISGPSTATTTTFTTLFGQVVKAGATKVSSATQCLTDSFSVTGSPNIPTVCGTLTGEHMYLDASTACNKLNFNLGSTGVGTNVATRNWQIQVTQYSCDYPNKAPSGCLQYYYGSSTGTVQSFNYAGSPSYHLADQEQSICIRRERGNCRICWWATAATDVQLSAKTATPSGFDKGSSCCAYKSSGKGTKYDCVIIPGASKVTLTPVVMVAQSICGRSAGLVTATGTTSTTVCSKRTPFKLTFHSDKWEVETEAKKSSGFKLNYSQSSC